MSFSVERWAPAAAMGRREGHPRWYQLIPPVGFQQVLSNVLIQDLRVGTLAWERCKIRFNAEHSGRDSVRMCTASAEVGENVVSIVELGLRQSALQDISV